MSGWEDEEGYEAGKEDFGLPQEAAGCAFDGCLSFFFSFAIVACFLFVR